MEGIGYDFVPRVLDRSLVDEWYKCEDESTMPVARQLIELEGILCGNSSGAALHGALTYCQKHKLGKDKRVVVVLVDGIRNYMTKFLQNEWMIEKGLYGMEKLEHGKQKAFFGQKETAELDLPKAKLFDLDTTTVGMVKECLLQGN
jgi:cystathionine beta-synthase